MTDLSPVRRLWRDKAGPRGLALFLTPYLAVVGLFSYVDVYHRHFFEPRFSLPYNAARIVFTAYLFWMVYFAGAASLRKYFAAFLTLPLTYQLPLGFFVGAALWTLGLLVLGYLGLYHWQVAIGLTAVILAASYGHFLEVAESFIKRCRNLGPRHALFFGMAGLVLVFAVLLLMVKGLYPAGGHDYFTHYFHYYNAVINRHDIWPNEVWYHYYYSKAMGLFFLGMLLTDPLAPSLVTFCFATATALALFTFVDRFDPGTLWPWVSVILYFALYITTPSAGFYAVHGGWGDFQKSHEINAAFMIAILWMSISLIAATGEERKVWWFAGALCSFVLAFVTTVSSLLVGLFFGLMVAVSLLFRGRHNAKAFFYLGVATAGGILSVLGLNYVTTGLPHDNGIHFFWPILDLQRLREWGVVPEVVQLAIGRSGQLQNRLPLASSEMYAFLRSVFRAEVLGFFLLYTLAGALIWTAVSIVVWGVRISRIQISGFRGVGESRVAAFATALAFLGSVLAVGVVAGSAQAISFVRYSSFALPLMIGITAAAWQLMAASLPAVSGLRVLAGYVIPLVLMVSTWSSAYGLYGPAFTAAVSNAGRFVTGRFSIYDSYVDQSGWPGRSPEGAIRPWAFAVWKELGPGTRFWVFDTHTYCMLPNCRPETFSSFRMSPRSLELLLDGPQQARAILQSEGLNYFLIAMDDRVDDLFPCSELFSPEHVAEYMGIKWRDDAHFLLTWLGPGVEPLTPEWVETYRQAIRTAPCWLIPPFQKLRSQLANNPRWGASLARP